MPPPKTQKRPGHKARAAPAFARPVLLADLQDEQQRDDERVDDERLDEREAENHRAADLASCTRVAGDAVERSGGRAALTDATAEGGDADAETGCERDETEVVREAAGRDFSGVERGFRLREREGRDAHDEEEREERNDVLGLHDKSPGGRAWRRLVSVS